MKNTFVFILTFVLVSSAFGRLEITDIDFDKFPEVNVHVVKQIDLIDTNTEKFYFTLTENGKVVDELTLHRNKPIPKATVLTFDVSKSIDKAMFARGKQLANVFVESKSPADLVAITSFGERSEVVSEFSQKRDVLLNAISDLKIESGKTALNDAIYDSLTLLSRVLNSSIEKCVIVFSDGKEENSALISSDPINLARSRKVKVHTVGLANNPKTLIRISKLTGGKHFQVETQDLASPLSQKIFDSSPREFILTYKSSAKRGSEHKNIEIAIQHQVNDAIETATGEFQIEPAELQKWKTIVVISIVVFGSLLIGFVVFSIHKKRERICPICGREMLPEWTECQFCAENADQEILTGCLISGSGVEYGLTDNTLIGRSEDNNIVLTHPSVSRQHALIKFENGKHRVFDLGAKNGVLINELRIEESQQLYNEDEIKLGEVSLVFRNRD